MNVNVSNNQTDDAVAQIPAQPASRLNTPRHTKPKHPRSVSLADRKAAEALLAEQLNGVKSNETVPANS